MEIFNAGTVQTSFTVNTSGLKADLVTIENLFAKSSEVSGNKYNAGFLGNLKARKIGNDMRIDIKSGLNASKLGKESAEELTSSFNKGTNGFLGKINFGALSFGLNIATLAFEAISASIEKAKLKEEQHIQTLLEFNAVAIETEQYLKEVDRVQRLAADSSKTAAEKVAILSGEYETLDSKLQKLGFADKEQRAASIRKQVEKVTREILELEKDLYRIRLKSQNRSSGENSPAEKVEIETLKKKIANLKASKTEQIENAKTVSESESPVEGEARLIAEANRDAIRAREELTILTLSGKKKLQAELEDELLIEQKIKENRLAGFKKPVKDAVDFVRSRRQAIDQAQDKRTNAVKAAKKAAIEEAAANLKIARAEQERSAEIERAKQLFNSARTPIEQYRNSLQGLADTQSDLELNSKAGGDKTFQRQRIAAILKLAQTSKDAALVFAEFERLQKAGLITTDQATAAQVKLNDVLGITVANEKKLAKQKEDSLKLEAKLLFLEERKLDRKLLLARLANNNAEVQNLERQLELQERIAELVERGGKSEAEATVQATREIAEEDVARARGVFRSGFSDGLRAAIDGDLGSYLEDKLKDLASGMFDRAVENLADAVFDQLSQIAPGFLGQITGNSNLSQSLTNATGTATQAVGGVANQVAGAGTQAAGTAGAATAITTAFATGGTTAGTTIATAMTTGSTSTSAGITAAMTAGGATAGTTIGTSMTVAGMAVAAQIAAAMALQGGGLSGDQLGAQLKGLDFGSFTKFAGFFADGGKIPRGQFGIAGEAGAELIAGPATVIPFNKPSGFSTNGLESRGSNQTTPSNVVMNISGVKDLGSFVKSQGTIEADMAAAMRRAQADF